MNSYSYTVARAYMIRLVKSDFETPAVLAALAAEAKMTPHQFRARFEYVTGAANRGHRATIAADPATNPSAAGVP